MSRPSHGFTLVEIMVVVAILALIVLVGAPLTSGWSASADMVNGKGALIQAVSRAKSMALRNEVGVTEGNSGAAICIDSNKKIEVRKPTSASSSANCSTNGGTAVWSTNTSLNLTFKVGTDTLSCLCFDNKGQVISSVAASCDTCGSSTQVTLSASGVDDETISLF